ncbi:hypothetical protein [Hyphomonas sp.]|uniref:hypothetical protein n=1 Tax=Hyphomonas sp. TaxID=87 RepID=UPI003528E7AA
MYKLVLAAATAALLTACASAPAPAPEAAAPEPAYLPYDAFKKLVNSAYQEDDYDTREAAFAELLARDDLRQDDLAETYLMRGLIRGVYTSAGPHAGPYCAVEDFAKFEALASPDHPRMKQMLEGRAYQTSRYQYFDEPASCGD